MVEESRRSRLLGLKLTALIRDHDGAADIAPLPFALGAAAITGMTGWVLLDERQQSGLGPSLAWALRAEVERLNVLAEEATGTLARRAEAFRLPIEIWHVDERMLLPAIAEPLEAQVEVPAEHERFRTLIEAGGATPTTDHGALIGEVRGLEVCRVVDDATSGNARLEVGIGQHDREAFQMMHGDVPTVEALAKVVAAVEPHRRNGAAPHPLNRIAREQALRATLVDEPVLVGASSVEPLPSPVPRKNLKDAQPCLAAAVIDGQRITLVVSAGVDLDVVPFATDGRLATGHPTRIVVPARDAVPVQREISGLLLDRIPVVPVD